MTIALRSLQALVGLTAVLSPAFAAAQAPGDQAGFVLKCRAEAKAAIPNPDTMEKKAQLQQMMAECVRNAGKSVAPK